MVAQGLDPSGRTGNKALLRAWCMIKMTERYGDGRPDQWSWCCALTVILGRQILGDHDVNVRLIHSIVHLYSKCVHAHLLSYIPLVPLILVQRRRSTPSRHESFKLPPPPPLRPQAALASLTSVSCAENSLTSWPKSTSRMSPLRRETTNNTTTSQRELRTPQGG